MNVNQDKGLPERLYEKFQTHFNYKVFVNADMNNLYNDKNKYVDQMNDPIMVIVSKDKELNLPDITYNSLDTQDIDVMSFGINLSENSNSPAMIRLRNRSLKPQIIRPVFLTYNPEGDRYSYMATLGRIMYGVSDKETMANLNYTQKESQNYKVNSTHHVLQDQKDKFITLEQKLIQGLRLSQNSTEVDVNGKNVSSNDLKHNSSSVSLQPGESANFKVFTIKFTKSEGHESVLAENLMKMHEEEQNKEKMYKNSNSKGA